LIVGRTLAAVTALIALATATTIAVVAAAFALYFVLEPLVGRAGASALLAGAFALVVAICVLIAASNSGGRNGQNSHQSPQHDFSLIERVVDMVKDKPILSIGAAIAAGLIAIRNPALVATIVAAFMQPKRND